MPRLASSRKPSAPPRLYSKSLAGAPSTQLLTYPALRVARDDAIPVMMQFVARACAVLGWPARGPLAIGAVKQFTVGVFVLQKQKTILFANFFLQFS